MSAATNLVGAVLQHRPRPVGEFKELIELGALCLRRCDRAAAVPDTRGPRDRRAGRVLGRDDRRGVGVAEVVERGGAERLVAAERLDDRGRVVGAEPMRPGGHIDGSWRSAFPPPSMAQREAVARQLTRYLALFAPSAWCDPPPEPRTAPLGRRRRGNVFSPTRTATHLRYRNSRTLMGPRRGVSEGGTGATPTARRLRGLRRASRTRGTAQSFRRES